MHLRTGKLKPYTMKEIKILSRSVKVDTEKLAKGLADMHKQKTETYLALQFGMLNAPLMEMFKKGIEVKILNQFSEVAKMIYEEEINAFITDCFSEISKRVYHFVDMKV